jgi:hypothetical protein
MMRHSPILTPLGEALVAGAVFVGALLLVWKLL